MLVIREAISSKYLILNFVKIIGSHGTKEGKFDDHYDVKFSTDGNMYVAKFNNKRVQIIGQQWPVHSNYWSNHVGLANGKVYVSDFTDDGVVVYNTTGEYVTSWFSW